MRVRLLGHVTRSAREVGAPAEHERAALDGGGRCRCVDRLQHGARHKRLVHGLYALKGLKTRHLDKVHAPVEPVRRAHHPGALEVGADVGDRDR